MGHVYFFREVGRTACKIGMTNNGVIDRFNAFKTYTPNHCYIIGTIPSKDPKALENELHDKFKKNRLTGEFFEVSDEVVLNTIYEYNPKYRELIDTINIELSEGTLNIDEIINIIRTTSTAIQSNDVDYNEIRICMKIKEFMEYIKVTSLSTTTIEIMKNIFHNDKISAKSITNVLKKYGEHQGIIRYVSPFNGQKLVGKVYTIKYEKL